MRTVAVAAVLVLGLAVVGCSGDDPGSPSPMEETSAVATEPTESGGESASSGAEMQTNEDAERALDSFSEDSSLSDPELDAVSCELETVPSQVPLENGRVHVDKLPGDFVYNTVPASQGPHHDEWLRWGVYDTPIPELNVVHNLEHGGITIQYGPDVTQDGIMALIDWFIEDSDAIVIAPHNGLGRVIALAAWTVDDLDQDVESVYRSSEGNVLRCTGFDEALFSDFRENYRGRAPERIPLDRMQAGSR